MENTNTKFKYICIICQTGFTQKYNLNRHLKNKHEENKHEENKNLKEKKNIVQTIKCLHCHEHFLTRTSLKIHSRKKHINKIENNVDNITRYRCSICKSTFSNMLNLNNHCLKKHVPPQPNSITKLPNSIIKYIKLK
jgi:DNA-directed RNA polymerase subunit RPC12/RpoP